jgi:hypothetical protein
MTPSISNPKPHEMTFRVRPSSERLLTPKQLSAKLGVSRGYVYEHSAELGAMRLGAGPRARLRFDLEDVLQRISCLSGSESIAPDPAPVAETRRGRRRRSGTNVELLPIRGRAEGS